MIRRKSNETLPNNIRNEFMRDRDRILYSEPFRRLAGKTQVYSTGNGDYMRTRLTHTLEVSQIARTISAYLNLNCDLTEAIALAHDIGHAPFGHAGERTLHFIMTPHEDHYIEKCPFNKTSQENENQYGFKHNLQGVKLANSSKLNLTNYTLYGIRAHSYLTYQNEDFHELGFYKQHNELISVPSGKNAWSLEAYVVRIADEIAQRHHDLEDAIIGKIITKNEVNSMITSNLHCEHNLDSKLEDARYEKQLSSFIVNKLVCELIKETEQRILDFQAHHDIAGYDDRDNFEANEEELRNLVSYSNDFKKHEKEFSDEIKNRVISSYDIQAADSRGSYVIKKLFQAFYETPQQLPDNSIVSYLLRMKESPYSSIDKLNEVRCTRGIGYLRNKFNNIYKPEVKEIDDILLMRVICDHIAGMTDSYALSTYRKLYGY